MINKKVPGDIFGLIFYTLGLTLGGLFKIAGFVVVKFVQIVYGLAKRDTFKRRLRLAVGQTRAEDPSERHLGRENIRNLICRIGLTDEKWHQSVRLRKNIAAAVSEVAGYLVKNGDLSEMEVADWKKVVESYLFANFDRTLLESKPKQKAVRKHRISRRKMSMRNQRQATVAVIKNDESDTQPVVQGISAADRQARDFTESISRVHINTWANEE